MTDQAVPQDQAPEEKPSPPRVLQLCAVDFTVRQFLAPLALHLQSQGLSVRVACTKGPYWEELKSWGLEMVPLRIARSANVLSHVWSALRLFVHLKRRPVDILHVHTPVAALIGRLVGRLAGVPTIIYTAHGFYFHDRMPRWKYRAHVLMEKLAAKFHDHLFCVSEEDARSAERLGIEHSSRITVVRNGADPERYLLEVRQRARAAIRAELGIPADAPVVTIMGRMTREKGYLEFFQAARLVHQEIPGAHFLAVGDVLKSDRDRIRREIEKLANHRELDGQTHLVGLRTDVPELLAASDLFVLPSHREGLPVSIIEAMMMELPVVATNIRGCREEVVDGSTGFLVPVESVKDLAGAVRYLLQHPEVARKMGAAGRRRALELYTLRATLEIQWQVYRKIIAEMRG